MGIIVKGRNTEVSDRFRTHVNEKLSKIERFASGAQRVDVKVTHEPNLSQAEVSERIEITVIDKDPVIRAEAAVSDRYGTLDLASGKLLERLRRACDRHREHRCFDTHVSAPLTLIPRDASIPKAKEQAAPETTKVPTVPGEEVENQLGDSPVIVRQKLYETQPMSVDRALCEMELVGHPFYLFVDKEAKRPCAVYHHHGWIYGVIHLDTRAV